jgi:hypothetical protein
MSKARTGKLLCMGMQAVKDVACLEKYFTNGTANGRQSQGSHKKWPGIGNGGLFDVPL